MMMVNNKKLSIGYQASCPTCLKKPTTPSMVWRMKIIVIPTRLKREKRQITTAATSDHLHQHNIDLDICILLDYHVQYTHILDDYPIYQLHLLHLQFTHKLIHSFLQHLLYHLVPHHLQCQLNQDHHLPKSHQQ